MAQIVLLKKVFHRRGGCGDKYELCTKENWLTIKGKRAPPKRNAHLRGLLSTVFWARHEARSGSLEAIGDNWKECKICKYSWSGQVDHSDQLSERLQVSYLRLLYKCCEDSKIKMLLSVINNYSFNYRQIHPLSCHGQLKTHWVCCKLVPTGAVVALVPSPEETLGGGLWGILFQTSC